MLKRNSFNAHWKFGACQKWELAGRIGDFGNFLNGFAKSPRVLRWFWKLVLKNCAILHLSEVCMIKTPLHITVSRQMWCIKSMKCWFTRTKICWQDIVTFFKLFKRQKFGLICFPRIRLPGLIYCDKEPLWLLNVIEDNCHFLGVHIRLSTRCKIFFHSEIT